jgi:hypothetical protein
VNLGGHLRGQDEQGQESVLPGMAAVVSEREFFQIGLKMASFDSTMVGAAEPGLEIPNDPMHPRQNLSSSCGVTLDPGMMLVAVSFQPLISIPVISVNPCPRSNVSANEPVQGMLGSIRDEPKPDPAGVIPSVLDCHNDQAFARAPSGLPSTGASDVGFVDFYHAAEGLPHGIDHGSAQAPTHGEGRPVRPPAHLTLQLQGRNPRRQRAHQVGCPEPVAQGKACPMHDRPGRDRNHGMALAALKEAAPDKPRTPMPASGALEPLWPAHPHQVLQAGLVRREGFLELRKGPRETGVARRHADRLRSRTTEVKCISMSSHLGLFHYQKKPKRPLQSLCSPGEPQGE